MAACKLHVLAALCSLLILMTFIGGTQSASCCLRYSRRSLPCRRLEGYTLQTISGSCDIRAVIFHTRRGFICADPFKDATILAMKCVNDKVKRAHE